MNNVWIMIVVMALITFFCRYSFFMKVIDIQLSKKVQTALKYTAPAVLTTMWVPIVFQVKHSETLIDVIHNPFFYAGILTIILSLKLKNTLLVIALSMTSFVGLKWLMG
ncbi:AzlD domain-containing protein [Algicola sagamiensis]|uniref:AzlD domain-containing protein n=1 Tax=Algicola sagamiensis TaxID=163869 RepID=UPI00037DFBDF|nr:AzlD domain-containing protein [Algicola sagamiensis]